MNEEYRTYLKLKDKYERGCEANFQETKAKVYRYFQDGGTRDSRYIAWKAGLQEDTVKRALEELRAEKKLRICGEPIIYYVKDERDYERVTITKEDVND